MNKITSKIFIKNSLVNSLGVAVQVIVGFISLPLITRMLSPEKFGLLSLLWTIFVYLSFFDIGIGPAVTRYVSKANANGDSNYIAAFFWSANRLQIILGLTGLLLVYFSTDFIIYHILNLPNHLILEAKYCFYLISISIPFVLLTSSLKGMLEAYQRFDLINYVQIPIILVQYISPIMAGIIDTNLTFVVTAILLSRIFGVIVYFMLIVKLHPEILNNKKVNYSYMKVILGFGGWITVSSLLSPILVQSDRFIISSYRSLAEVGFYSVAIDTATRLLIISRGITPVIFPMLSAATSINELVVYFRKGLMSICYSSLPLLFFLIVFSKEIFTIWLGQDYGNNSSVCFVIALIGIYSCLLSQIPLTALQAIGFPEIVARIHIIETPIFFIVLFPAIKYGGVIGAVVVWSIRLFVEMALFYYLLRKKTKLSFSDILPKNFIAAQICFVLITMVSLVINNSLNHAQYRFVFMVIGISIILIFYIISLKKVYYQFRHNLWEK